MGAGGKETTLELFETHLRKLLHIMDKLPKHEREKAVMILKNSADYFSNLTTTGQMKIAPPQPPADVAAAAAAAASASQLVMVVDHSAVAESSRDCEQQAAVAQSSVVTAYTDQENTYYMPPDSSPGGVDQPDPAFLLSPAAGELAAPQNQSSGQVIKAVKSDHKIVPDACPVSCLTCRKRFSSSEPFIAHLDECRRGHKAAVKTPPAVKTAATAGGNKQPPLVPTTAGSKKSSPAAGAKENLRCDECQRNFLTAFQLERHRQGHTNNNCHKCEAKFAKKRLLVHHLKSAHGVSAAEKYYTCRFCARKFVKKPSLWGHYSEHTVGAQVVCTKCGDILEDEAALEEHMDEHRRTAPYSCRVCGESFARRQQLLAHVPGHDKYRCAVCQQSFSSKKRLRYHRNMEHDTGGTAGGEEAVEDGKRTDTGKRTCPSCNRSFKSEDKLKSHVCRQMQQQEVDVEDDTRGRRRQTANGDAGDGGGRSDPVMAVYVRTPKGRYKCRACSYEDRRPAAVVRHYRVHRNHRQFVCEICGSAFNAPFTLKEHRAYVHSEMRGYSCARCDKTFKAKNALIRHEQVHSEHRPYVCKCGQNYKRMSHLKRHMETVHSQDQMCKAEADVGRKRHDYVPKHQSPNSKAPKPMMSGSVRYQNDPVMPPRDLASDPLRYVQPPGHLDAGGGQVFVDCRDIDGGANNPAAGGTWPADPRDVKLMTSTWVGGGGDPRDVKSWQEERDKAVAGAGGGGGMGAVSPEGMDMVTSLDLTPAHVKSESSLGCRMYSTAQATGNDDPLMLPPRYGPPPDHSKQTDDPGIRYGQVMAEDQEYPRGEKAGPSYPGVVSAGLGGCLPDRKLLHSGLYNPMDKTYMPDMERGDMMSKLDHGKMYGEEDIVGEAGRGRSPTALMMQEGPGVGAAGDLRYSQGLATELRSPAVYSGHPLELRDVPPPHHSAGYKQHSLPPFDAGPADLTLPSSFPDTDPPRQASSGSGGPPSRSNGGGRHPGYYHHHGSGRLEHSSGRLGPHSHHSRPLHQLPPIEPSSARGGGGRLMTSSGLNDAYLDMSRGPYDAPVGRLPYDHPAARGGHMNLDLSDPASMPSSTRPLMDVRGGAAPPPPVSQRSSQPTSSPRVMHDGRLMYHSADPSSSRYLEVSRGGDLSPRTSSASSSHLVPTSMAPPPTSSSMSRLDLAVSSSTLSRVTSDMPPVVCGPKVGDLPAQSKLDLVVEGLDDSASAYSSRQLTLPDLGYPVGGQSRLQPPYYDPLVEVYLPSARDERMDVDPLQVQADRRLKHHHHHQHQQQAVKQEGAKSYGRASADDGGGMLPPLLALGATSPPPTHAAEAGPAPMAGQYMSEPPHMDYY